jgi:hypothetical protein
MEGGVCFPLADGKLDITRTAFGLEASVSGEYFRLPRTGERQFFHQGLRLRLLYEELGSQRPITLCDDGIGTGKSLERIVSLFEQLSLDVREIVVLANPHNREEIRNVPVTTLLPEQAAHAWLNERDLYWGLPRSGVSLALHDASIPVCGVPYTIDVRMVETRIELTGAAASAFRRDNLRINGDFWRRLEQDHNRELTVRDCGWLRFLGDRFRDPDKRIATILHELAETDDFQLVPEAQTEA